jgi:hypothetical protein
VPNNLLNANFPISSSQLHGYFTIANVDTNNYYINIDHRSGNYNAFGGNDVYVTNVLQIQAGYTHANTYSITLNDTYTNIIYATIVSSAFPNSQQIVRNSPANKKNNSFYWENIEDGNYVYSVTLNPGNYTPQSLATQLEKLIANVARVNFDTANTAYAGINNMNININTDTNIVTVTSYKTALLQKPLINVQPSIPSSPTSTDPSNIVIQIFQPSHNLTVGTTISIQGAIDYLGIPASSLNTNFIVHSVIDSNNYTINITNLNLLQTRTDTKGGNAILITVPNIFRLRMDYSDNIGQILGFRNVGNTDSISVYSSSVTNNQAYVNELTVDAFGNTISLSNLSLNFVGDTYIDIVCPQLGIQSVFNDANKKIFGRILLEGSPGEISYNTFVDLPQTYYNTIADLYQLEFMFLAPDGTLFDFNGQDHSFIIKIVSIADNPKGTSINTKIGKFT